MDGRMDGWGDLCVPGPQREEGTAQMGLLTASAGVGEAQEGRGAQQKPEQSPVTQPACTERIQLGQGGGHSAPGP